MRNLLFVFILAGFLGAQEPPPIPKADPAIELNNEAVELLKKKQYASAVEKLRKAVDLQKIEKGEADKLIQDNLRTALLRSSSAAMEKQDFTAADRLILEAKRLDATGPLIPAYEGILAYRRGYLVSATEFLLESLRRDPKLGVGHEFMGMIQYKKEQLPEALTSWKAAILHEPARKKHLSPLIAKVERELTVERSMQTLRSTHFTCKFGDTQNRGIANEVLKMLEDAYTKVGAEFREYPRQTLTAILYADREFRGATNAQGWAAGIFDGKIRVPVKNFARSRQNIRATLIHEYTHFVVSRLVRRPPAWLNEGLAQIMEGKSADRDDALLKRARDAGALKKMQLLSASFATMRDAGGVRLAYAQSLSFVGFLQRTYSMSRLVEILRHMGKGLKADQALHRVTGRTLADLERLWLADF